MHLAVRYKDGTKNLLSYKPSEAYSVEEVMAGAKEMLKEAGKDVAVVLMQVSNNEQAVVKQSA